MGLNSNIISILVLLSALVPASEGQNSSMMCPLRGCTPHGSFAFATPLPTLPDVKWIWTSGQLMPGTPYFKGKGCTSSIFIITCPTDKGYVTIKPDNGKLVWQSKNMSSPYLSIIDFSANVIGSDNTTVAMVTYDGKVDPVKVSQYQPQFGPVLSENQNIMVTSSREDTPQVISLITHGSPFEASNLTGQLGNFSGTFIPCGNPILDKSRAYVITRFIPHNKSSPAARDIGGSQRLYAIDLPKTFETPNIIAWFKDLPRDSNYFKDRTCDFNNIDYISSLLVFHNDTIFINYATSSIEKSGSSVGQPWQSTLCAVQDKGRTSTIVYTTTAWYGPMAIYDVHEPWLNITSNSYPVLWIANRSPPMFAAFDTHTGKTISTNINFPELAPDADGFITSDLLVARQPDHPDRDVLIVGTQASEGHAFVVAIETGLPANKPRLLWSKDVSGPRRAPGRISQWTVGDQMASVAVREAGEWHFGLAISVTESLLWMDASQLYVKLLMG